MAQTHSEEPEPVRAASARHVNTNAWNWLLVLPLIATLFPWFYNSEDPKLFGLPFFYWYQFAFVPLGVLCVGLVYVKTKDTPVVTGKPDKLGVDDLDEGAK